MALEAYSRIRIVKEVDLRIHFVFCIHKINNNTRIFWSREFFLLKIPIITNVNKDETIRTEQQDFC